MERYKTDPTGDALNRRYRDALARLEKLERDEQRLQRVGSILRLGISRLLLIADDSSSAVASQLADLRSELRGNLDADRLEAVIHALSEAIRRLDEVPPPPGPAALLCRLAEALPLAGPKWRALCTWLDRDDVDPVEKVDRLAEHLRASLPELLGETPAPEELPTHEVLLRLTERLEVPRELVSRVDAIKSRLAAGLAPQELEAVLAAIAAVVREMRGRALEEKRDLEAFLRQTTAGLKELDQTLRSNVEQRRESYDDGVRLDDAMHAEVQDIENSINSAVDLRAAQELVHHHLNTIRQQLTRFRSAEAQRLQLAEREVEVLSGRLKDMEVEVGRLQERVRSQRSQALVDPLTGIPNRLAYDERIALEFARWRRYGTPLCLAVWDVDRFKRINDRYGHQAGDKVLRVVAKMLKGHIRATDTVARYGGEEFVMLLPDTEIDGALRAVEKLRGSIEACEFHYRGNPVAITVSCGLAHFGEGDDPEEVFRRADEALYRAKADGRNRCCVDPPLETTP